MTIKKLFEDDFIKNLEKMAILYVANVDAAVDGVENAKVYDYRTSIANSKRLGAITAEFLDVIGAIDQEMDEYEALMSQLEFLIRQEHNTVRYKLESTVTGLHWKYQMRANRIYTVKY